MAKSSFVFDAMPKKVLRILKTIGENGSIARKKRKISIKDMAQSILINRNTVTRIEKGDPRVSIGIYMAYAFRLQLVEDFCDIFSPQKDEYAILTDRIAMLQMKKVKKNKLSLDF